MKKIMTAFAVCLCALCGCSDDENNGTNFDASVVRTAEDFVDSRDGHVYSCVQIGNQIWMAENLAYRLPNGVLDGCLTWNEAFFQVADVEFPADIWAEIAQALLDSHDWDAEGDVEIMIQSNITNTLKGRIDVEEAMIQISMHSPTFYEALNDALEERKQEGVANIANNMFEEAEAENGNYSKKFGFLYSYEGAKKALPEGWRIPTDEDWNTLEETLGMNRSEIEKLNAWRGNGEGTLLKEGGEAGFNARMAGGDVYYASNTSPQYMRKDENCYFWSSTTQAQNDSIDLAIIRSLAVYSNKVWRGTSRIENGHRDMHYSVRCVKDIN